MRTVIGLFQDSNEARQTISDLQKLGARTQDISVVAPVGTSQIGAGLQLSPLDVPGLGRVSACGPVMTYLSQSTAQSSPGGIIAALVRMGISETEATRYVDGVRQGSTLETVMIEDDKANQALQIMRDHSIGIGGGGGVQGGAGGLGGQQQVRGQVQGQQQAQGQQVGRQQVQGQAGVQSRSGGDQVLPVIVEELEVGKREVNAGGVRATSRVEQIPAQEDVTLRQESVNVERRAVDRPIGSVDDAFRERSVEVVATSEEPVVTKRARIIEEIVIRHNVGSTTQTVRDTVRRTDVDVQPFEASRYREHYESQYGRAGSSSGKSSTIGTSGARTAATSGSSSGGDIKGTGTTASPITGDVASGGLGAGGVSGVNAGGVSARSGVEDDAGDYDFESYAPAYKFGHEMRGDERFGGDDWSSVEGNARSTWEGKNPGTWDRFKGAVMHAWERAKGD